MQLNIPTNDDIRFLVREELAAFFTSNTFQPQPEDEEFGGIDLAVKITGKAKPTIYALCARRGIPHSKKGNQLYFSKKDLLDWIQSGKRRTASEIQTAA